MYSNWSKVNVLENHCTNLNHWLLRGLYVRKMPILVTGVCGFADVLIRFWGQKVKVTAGDDTETL